MIGKEVARRVYLVMDGVSIFSAEEDIRGVGKAVGEHNPYGYSIKVLDEIIQDDTICSIERGEYEPDNPEWRNIPPLRYDRAEMFSIDDARFNF